MIAIVLWVAAGLYIIMILIFRKFIILATSFVYRGIKPIKNIKTIVLVPIINSVLALIF